MSILLRAGGKPQRIPQVGAGWGGSLPASNYVPGFFWDANNNVLYTQTFSNQFNVFLNVTQGVVRNLLNSPYSDLEYALICNIYPACLLSENCVPITTEGGVILQV
jgi:hypothetical protein